MNDTNIIVRGFNYDDSIVNYTKITVQFSIKQKKTPSASRQKRQRVQLHHPPSFLPSIFPFFFLFQFSYSLSLSSQL
ncbi:hypothetical protein RIF29_40691 [Crotalaria pallida]|uniref:Uncharacterized protein n=1 Tax=Crotalaria pallida TaxID=3830 RepID=A0AAN9E3N2_CROPI